MTKPIRVVLWSFVTLVAGIVGLGELAYARNFAGEEIGTAVIFEDGKPETHQIAIGADDLPVRINLEMWGLRDRIGNVNRAYVTLATGGVTLDDTIGFDAAISDKGDLASWSGTKGNLTLGPAGLPDKSQASRLFMSPAPGDWSQSASVSDEWDFKMDKIVATIKRGRRNDDLGPKRKRTSKTYADTTINRVSTQLSYFSDHPQYVR